MPITLGEARQLAIDSAWNMADETADRLADRWIREALEDLWTRRDWKHFLALERITLDVEEGDGLDDLTVTQDSGAISRTSGNWLAKYVDYSWDLLVEDDDSLAFQLGALGAPATNATLATGQEWLQASGATKAYVLARWRYDLPQNFVRRLCVVEVLPGLFPVKYVTPAELDRTRAAYPHTRSLMPEIYTVRGAFLEVWPALGTERRAIQLTYQRKPTYHADDDDDADELDWPAEYRALLHAAIRWRASASPSVGEAPYALALREYEAALARYESVDGKMTQRRRSVGLRMRSGPSLPWRGGIARHLGELPSE